MNTEISAVAAMLEATEDDPTPLQRESGRIDRMLALAVIIIAVVVVTMVFAISDIQTPSDAVTVLLLGVLLAVAAVPEGLPAILSVVLAHITGAGCAPEGTLRHHEAAVDGPKLAEDILVLSGGSLANNADETARRLVAHPG
jgi:cation transport ATPase